MEAAARKISAAYGCAVLCKGGHQTNDANDLLCDREGNTRWFMGRRIANPNTHGTGCTLSSAIAANLAKGFCLEDSVERAKTYLSGALAAMLDLGRGSGPMDHAFDIKPEYRICLLYTSPALVSIEQGGAVLQQDRPLPVHRQEKGQAYDVPRAGLGEGVHVAGGGVCLLYTSRCV